MEIDLINELYSKINKTFFIQLYLFKKYFILSNIRVISEFYYMNVPIYMNKNKFNNVKLIFYFIRLFNIWR